MFPNDHFWVREQWDSQIAENSARHAWAWGSATTSGWGELLIDEPVMFGLVFVHYPSIFYGFALDDDEQLVDGRFPRCGGGVVRWVKDADDYYVGAYVYVTVATADPLVAAQSSDVPGEFAEDPGYDITHSFTFAGLAYKPILEGEA